MTAPSPQTTIAGLRDKVANLRRQHTRALRERDDARDEVVKLCQERLQLKQALAAAEDRRAGAVLRERQALAERDAARAALDRVREAHRGIRIYDECGHKHEAPDTVLGIQSIPDVGLVCADGYMYTICAECCRDGDYQSEHCANDHSHTVCHPCPTLAALDGSGT